MVGVDTLKLRLSDYSISPNPCLKLRYPDVDAATGEAGPTYPLWPDGKGGYVQAARAYHNADTLKVTVSRLGNDEGGVGLLDVGCWVECSLPRLAHGNNFHALNEREVAGVLGNVQDELKNLGICTNIEAAALSRLDVFNNVQADEPFECYSPLFNLMHLSRMPKRDYGTTFLYANGLQETCIYDKLEEMSRKAKKSRQTFNAGAYPANTIRFENRLLKPKKIRDVLGFETARDLVGGGHEVITSTFRGTMRKQFFSRSVGDIAAASARQLESEMLRFKLSYGRNWQQHYLQAEGLRSLTEIHGLEVVKRAVANVTGTDTEADRKRLQRLSKQLEDARFDLEMLREARPSRRKLGDLYCELESKLMAA